MWDWATDPLSHSVVRQCVCSGAHSYDCAGFFPPSSRTHMTHSVCSSGISASLFGGLASFNDSVIRSCTRLPLHVFLLLLRSASPYSLLWVAFGWFGTTWLRELLRCSLLMRLLWRDDWHAVVFAHRFSSTGCVAVVGINKNRLHMPHLYVWKLTCGMTQCTMPIHSLVGL